MKVGMWTSYRYVRLPPSSSPLCVCTPQVRFYWEQSFKSSQVPRPDAWWVCCPSNASQKVPVSSKKKKMAEEIFVHPKKKTGWWRFSNIFWNFHPEPWGRWFFYFHPYLGKTIQFDSYFSIGLKQPTRKKVTTKLQKRSEQYHSSASTSAWGIIIKVASFSAEVDIYFPQKSGVGFSRGRDSLPKMSEKHWGLGPKRTLVI